MTKRFPGTQNLLAVNYCGAIFLARKSAREMRSAESAWRGSFGQSFKWEDAPQHSNIDPQGLLVTAQCHGLQRDQRS